MVNANTIKITFYMNPQISNIRPQQQLRSLASMFFGRRGAIASTDGSAQMRGEGPSLEFAEGGEQVDEALEYFSDRNLYSNQTLMRKSHEICLTPSSISASSFNQQAPLIMFRRELE